MKLFFLLFLLIPLIEIYFLIQVGMVVGAGMTIFLVIFTAALGAVLVRMQGFSTLARVQNQVNQGQVPAIEMIEGVLLFIAGVLLLTPGFFTDGIGFILLTPSLRRRMIKWFINKGTIHGMAGLGARYHSGRNDSKEKSRIIDAEFKDSD